MSFREKVAWGSALGSAGVYGLYFWRLWRALSAGDANPAVFAGLFVSSVVMLVAVQIVLAVVLALMSPKEAEAPRDEREKMIERGAAQAGFVALNVLVLSVALASPFVAGLAPHLADGPAAISAAFLMANAILASVVLAELVHAGAQIVGYRMASA